MRENLIEGAVGPLNIMRMVMKMENVDEKGGGCCIGGGEWRSIEDVLSACGTTYEPTEKTGLDYLCVATPLITYPERYPRNTLRNTQEIPRETPQKYHKNCPKYTREMSEKYPEKHPRKTREIPPEIPEIYQRTRGGASEVVHRGGSSGEVHRWMVHRGMGRVRKSKNFPGSKIFHAKTFRIINRDIIDFATNVHIACPFHVFLGNVHTIGKKKAKNVKK